jgi:hypothetical protein
MKKALIVGAGKKFKKSAFYLAWVVILIGLQVGVGAPAYASLIWDLTGSYTVHYHLYPWDDNHSQTIDSMNLQTGDFSGTGFSYTYPSSTYTFTGSLTDSTFTMSYVYTGGLHLGSYGDETATIDSSGSFSGTYSGYDAYTQAYFENGTFWSTAGHATPLSPVPIPGAIWLFGSGLVGLLGLKIQRQ